MEATILEGRTLASSIRNSLREQILRLKKQGLKLPGLAVILVGDDPASMIYVRTKQSACLEVGIDSRVFKLEKSITQAQLNHLIDSLNEDISIHGILVQLPLPSHLNTDEIVQHIHPDKDVDGFHPQNLGRLVQKNPIFRPCTPAGIMQLLVQTRVPLNGIIATVVGISNIVGRPMVLELLNVGATVTACHRETRDLAHHVQDAELLVSATGNPHLIQGEWIKPGSIVIDVGMNRLPNGQWVGDVEFDKAKKRAHFITPVPGGVGPMTVACLLQNTWIAYLRHEKPMGEAIL